MNQEIIKAVREHAKANYEKDGWDVLVECWEDSDIAKAAAGAGTIDSAIRNVRKVLKTHDDYRRDIEGTIF